MDDSTLRFLAVTLLLMLDVAGSHAAVPAQIYWQKALPNTTMPRAISDLLDLPGNKAGASVNVGNTSSTGGVNVSTNSTGNTTVNVRPGHNPFNYLYGATQTQLHDDPNAALFFLRKDLRAGSKMSIRFAKTMATDARFLPLKTSESIPFSSEKLSKVLKRFSVEPGSADAEIMARTVEECEAPAAAGETRYCATSLESMVDFATAALGTRDVAAMSTTVLDESPTTATVPQVYTINTSGVRKFGGGSAGGWKSTVACHYQPYVYAVFFCHVTMSKTEGYGVSMVGEDGARVDAAAVCHGDTSRWNPKHLAFQVLKVKPGGAAVCHFLPEDHVLWATSK